MDKPNRTYLGEPIVEAARAEKAQQWIGLGLGRSFINKPNVFQPRTGPAVHAPWQTGI
jgi:hypothetical protein